MSNKDKEKVLLEEPVSAGTEAALSAPTYTPGKYTPSKSVTDAADALRKQNAQSPGQYKSKWQEKIDGTVDKILNREEFSYDINGDALYKQYADKFTRQGKTAMEDTIARASAMTGGYGNSYAQTAGQAAYAGEMQKLNDVIPELYQLALDKYTREGDKLRDDYAMLTDAENTEYGRHRDTVSDWRDERAYLTDRYDAEYDRDYGEFVDAESLRAESVGQARDDYWKGDTIDREDKATARAELLEAISSTGYNPTDAELAAAGLTREQANSYLNTWTKADGDSNYATLAERIASTGYKPTDAELAAAGMTRGEADAYREQYSLGIQDMYNSVYGTGGDDGDDPKVDEKDLYGGYTRAEFNTLMGDYVDEPDAAARYVRTADTDEARAAFRAFFGDEVYKEYFGGYAEETVTELESLLMTPEEFIHSGGREEYGDYLSYIDETAMRWRNEGKFKTDDEMIAFIQAMEEKM